MSTAATPYKVHVKLGQAEFSAEGPEETVRQQLADFLEIAPTYADRSRSSHPNGHSNGHADGNGSTNGNGHAESQQAAGASSVWETTIDPVLCRRLFSEDRNGLISLRVLPKTEDRDGDALFLILFGFLVLKGQSEVKASDLLAAAKQSGVSLSRIDHTLDRYDALVSRGGIKRGSRYVLTNPGIEHAESVALRMFG